MKGKIFALVTMSMLTAVAARADVEPTGKLEYFGTIDYYLRGDIDKKVKDDYDAAVDTLGNASYDITTTGGLGARLGLRKPVSNDLFDVGASASFVAGPKMDVDFVDSTIPPGTVHEEITTRYARLMAEAGVRLRTSERAYIRLGGAAGIGRGWAEDKFSGTGFYSGSQTFKRNDTAFTWELTPSIIIATTRARFEVGARYAVFPKIKETDDSRELDWKTFGVFFGAAF